MSLFKTEFKLIREKAKALLVAAFTATTWQAEHAYVENDLVKPVTANGHYYRCTTAGTSGTTAGTWPLTFWTAKTDGGVTWREESPVFVLDYEPVDYSYPCIIVASIDENAENQMALGNQPAPELAIILKIRSYLGKPLKKTFQQTRDEAFDVLMQTQHIIRKYPSLDGYLKVFRATAGVYSVPDLPVAFFGQDQPWLIETLVRK